jgi:hypothetical protein
VLALALIVWNSRKRKQATPPPRQRRDLDVRVDHVVSGARDVADRASQLAGSSDATTIESGWPQIRTDMLAVEGDTVNLAVHVGEAPVGHSLAELDRAMHALRDAVERLVELVGTAPDDEHAIDLSRQTVADRRTDVDTALQHIDDTRP